MLKKLIFFIMCSVVGVNAAEKSSPASSLLDFFVQDSKSTIKTLAAGVILGYAGYNLGLQLREYYDERVYINNKIQKKAHALLQEHSRASMFSFSYNQKRYTVHLVREKLQQGDGIKALLTHNAKIVREYFYKTESLGNNDQKKEKKIEYSHQSLPATTSLAQTTLVQPHHVCIDEHAIVPTIHKLALLLANDQRNFQLKTHIVSGNLTYAVSIIKKYNDDQNPNIVIESNGKARILTLASLNGISL